MISRRINVGETGQLLVTISNGRATDMPSRIDAQGLDVTFAGNQTSTNITNGSMSYENVYFYQVKPTAGEGSYTIPAITVSVEGQQLKSTPIEITVAKPKTDGGLAAAATKPYFGRFSLDAEEIYANQIVPLEIKAYVRGRNAIHDVSSASLDHESFVIQNFRDVKIDGVELNGSLYSIAKLGSHLFALKPGEHTLGPAEIGVKVLDSRRGGGFGFPSIFQSTRVVKVATNALTLTVKPLPEGAPASFTGGVGDFALTVNPSTTAVSVGDPISMEFIVAGVGNLGTLGAPVFSAAAKPDQWKTYEANKSLEPDQVSDGVAPGRATFSQVIIPLQETTEIPTFELTFFDPAKGEYVTRKTDPIPISVAADGGTAPATTMAFPAAATPGAQAAFPGPAAAVPTASFADVLHIQTGLTKWRPITAAVPGAKGGPLFFAFHVICSLGFFTLLAYGVLRYLRQKKLDAGEAIPTLNFQQSLRRIPKPGSKKHDFYRAVARSLSIWKSEHNEAPENLMEAVNSLSRRCDSFLYAGEVDSTATVDREESSEFLTVLKKLPAK